MRSLVAVLLVLLPGAAFAAKSPSIDPKAETVMANFAHFYEGLKSFQAKINTTIKIEAKGMKNEMESGYDIALEKPNRFALIQKSGMMGGTVISDGTTKIMCVPVLKKYTSGPAPTLLSEILDPMMQGMMEQSLPLGFEPFLAKDILADLKENAQKITYVGVADIAGGKADQIEIDLAAATVKLSIAQGDKPLLLLCESTMDLSKIPGDQLKQFEMKEFRRVTTWSDWQTDEPISPAIFKFQPPEGVELAPELVAMPKEKPSALIGQAAPDFALKDLEGKSVKLSDLRGKVVVIDFWATWCPPCVKSLPIVSEVTKDFAERGVVFYAINDKEEPAKIQEFLQAKNLAIPVLLEPDGAVMKLYEVSGIPQSVIIDKEGIIRAVHIGYRPGLKDTLTGELEAAIKGEKVNEPGKSAQ